MRQVLPAIGFALALSVGVAAAAAQVSTAPTGPAGVTAGSLAELCAQGGGTDSIAAAAVGYCRGFLIGVGQLHREIATARIRPPLFCLPDPSPSIEQAQASFVAWVRANPDQAGQTAAVGLLRWAAATYPCPARAAARR
ncbi:MAG: hypothetical protein K2X74_23480 [Acetobacteraceae bacterium]|nr:hypothetical protein [Acetobacteraceae bacterium]